MIPTFSMLSVGSQSLPTDTLLPGAREIPWAEKTDANGNCPPLQAEGDGGYSFHNICHSICSPRAGETGVGEVGVTVQTCPELRM